MWVSLREILSGLSIDRMDPNRSIVINIIHFHINGTVANYQVDPDVSIIHRNASLITVPSVILQCGHLLSIVILHIHTHTYVLLLHQERTWIFLHTLLKRADHQYLNSLHLACEVRTGMCEVLTENGLSFMYKKIRERISMPRVDSG